MTKPGEWRRWFAWHPVATVTNEITWLRWVERTPLVGGTGWSYRRVER